MAMLGYACMYAAALELVRAGMRNPEQNADGGVCMRADQLPALKPASQPARRLERATEILGWEILTWIAASSEPASLPGWLAGAADQIAAASSAIIVGALPRGNKRRAPFVRLPVGRAARQKETGRGEKWAAGGRRLGSRRGCLGQHLGRAIE